MTTVIFIPPRYFFQVAALDQLKTATPEGRFWINLDGTDVKKWFDGVSKEGVEWTWGMDN